MCVTVNFFQFQVIEQEGLQSNALEVGTYFLNSLKQLRDNFEIVGDVRGQVAVAVRLYIVVSYLSVHKFQGLMIAVELVENKKTRAPLPKKKFDRIWNETKNRGVLFGSGGLHGNVSNVRDNAGNSNNFDIFHTIFVWK